jgi:GntR family transcriptional regulator
MLPFHFRPRPGVPIYEQLIQAVRMALLTGALQVGDKFPSVREISRELSMNPNTVQKAVGQLVHDGLLEVHPGVGSIVAKVPAGGSSQEREALKRKLELGIAEAKSLGLEKEALIQICEELWDKEVKGGKK